MSWKFWKDDVEKAYREVMDRQRDAEREENLKLRQKISDLREAREAVHSLITTAAPMTEEKVVAAFAGAADHPVFLGVCQVIDASFDTLGHEARDGRNTEKQTNMLLGGQEALLKLKANLADYCARAAVREQMVGAEEKP